MQIHHIRVWNEVADTIEERTVTLAHVGRRDDDWYNQIMYIIRDDNAKSDMDELLHAGWEYYQPPYIDPEGREAAKELLELLYESPLLENEDEQQEN